MTSPKWILHLTTKILENSTAEDSLLKCEISWNPMHPALANKVCCERRHMLPLAGDKVLQDLMGQPSDPSRTAAHALGLLDV